MCLQGHISLLSGHPAALKSGQEGAAPAEGDLRTIRDLKIGRAQDRNPGFVECMGVDHCSGYIGMPQKFLYGAYVIALFKKMSGKGVPQGVRSNLFA